MNHFPKTVFLAATVCAALAGCANNEFTKTATRAPDSAAEQMCGIQSRSPHKGGTAANADQRFCVQQMQGEDMHR